MGSTRLPRKVLADIGGRPLIQYVHERASMAKGADEVLVATDSREVLDAVSAFGGRAVMTSSEHASGTDRIAEAVSSLECDIVVNVQGDEPLIEPSTIERVIELLADHPEAGMGTAAVRITSDRAARDPNVVKAAISESGHALYFSRSPIPYHRDLWKGPGDALASGSRLFKHIGIYSYRRDVLMRLAGLRPTALEMTERLEQLRALESGIMIAVAVVEAETQGVDTPEDLERVREILRSSP